MDPETSASVGPKAVAAGRLGRCAQELQLYERPSDRQIAETWVSWDTFGLALQVGLVFLPVSALDGATGGDGAAAPVQRGRPH